MPTTPDVSTNPPTTITSQAQAVQTQAVQAQSAGPSAGPA